MKIRTRFVIASIIVAMYVLSPAAAVIYDVPTDKALLELTLVVVYGQVEHVAVGPLWTDATVRIDRVLRGGVGGAAILVRQPGGFDPATGRGTSIMGLRMLRDGERVMLFLDRDPDGVYWTVDLGMGTFFEDREGYLSRPGVDEPYRNADRFGQWIADRSAGLEPAANYLVNEIPGPHRVTEAATWIRDRDCGDVNYRDNTFEANTNECFIDRDGDGLFRRAEPYDDENDNGQWDYAEPYVDADGNGQYTAAESLQDLNENGVWDPAEPYADTDGNGEYSYAERYSDSNGNGQYDVGEDYNDGNQNGKWDDAETYTDTNANGWWNDEEYYDDRNGNGRWDDAEQYTDLNENGQWDYAEYYEDVNGNGQYDVAEVGVDCVPGDYEGTRQRYDSSGHFYYVDADGSGDYNPDPDGNPDEVIVTGDDIDFHYLRWPHWNVKVTTSTAVTEGNAARVAAVNAAIAMWNGDSGSSVAIPPAVEGAFDLDGAAYWQNRMHVDFDVTDVCSIGWTWDAGNEVWAPECVSPLAMVEVVWKCNLDGETTFHRIPGGSGSAYRIDVSRIRLSRNAIDANDANKLVHVLAHELGHALGIDHADPHDGLDDIMDPQWTTSLTALSADDRAAVRKLYPPQNSGFGGGGGGGGNGDDSSDGGSDGGTASDDDAEVEAPLVPPSADFTIDVPCADGLCRALSGETVLFTDTSSGGVARRSWDFDVAGGRAPSGATARHAWTSPGFYRVTLTVSGAGKESSMSRMFLVEAADPAGTCVADGGTICLQDSRYGVAVEYEKPDGELRAGQVVHAGTNDSGLFSFFGRDNWEVLVKVLDGCAVNGRDWVFAASATDLGYVIRVTDTMTGELREFRNEGGRLARAVTDATAFADRCESQPASAAGASSDGTDPGEGDGDVRDEQTGACTSGLCLHEGRFEVDVHWFTDGSERSAARPARAGTDVSGLLWFFEPDNWEMLVKVLDGCGVNGHYWVFAASATDVGFDIEVTDTQTGDARHYTKNPGEAAVAMADMAAFSNACRP